MERQKQLYKRSLMIRFSKKILIILKSLLPKTCYDVLCKSALRAYKSLIRLSYFRYCIYYKVKGDKKNFKKVKIIHKVMPYSMVGTGGLSQTYDLAVKVVEDNIKGDIVECGVAQGGAAALMALIVSQDNKNNRKMWFFDSYEGLPDPTEKDYTKNEKSTGKHIQSLQIGSCLGTYEQVERLLFSTLGLNKKNIYMIKGWFENTLPEYKNKIDQIALLRIDADWYESTKCCLENLYDNVIKNGFIVIDDYGTCFGAKKAVDEFLSMKKLSVELTHDGRGGCYFIKS